MIKLNGLSIRGSGLAASAPHDTDQLPLDALMSSMRDLVQRTRAGRIRSSDEIGQDRLGTSQWMVLAGTRAQQSWALPLGREKIKINFRRPNRLPGSCYVQQSGYSFWQLSEKPPALGLYFSQRRGPG